MIVRELINGVADFIRKKENSVAKVPINDMLSRLDNLPDSGEPQFGDDFPILDGNTHIWVKYPHESVNRTFLFNFKLNSGTLTIDYGDGTVETFNEVSTNTQTATHEYTTVGNYIVTISCDGEFTIGNTLADTYAFGSSLEKQRIYLLEIGNGCIAIGRTAMTVMGLLRKVAINIGDGNELITYSNSIYQCPAIESIKIYSGATNSTTYTFPSGQLYSLLELDTKSIKNINGSGYSYSYAIPKVNISEYAEIIKNNTLRANYALKEITIPASIKTLQSLCVNGCPNITKIVFKGTPESINATAFNDMTQECDVYVPWGEDEVANAPWGLTNSNIHYNYTETDVLIESEE